MSIVKRGQIKNVRKMRNQRLSYADYMKLALYDEQYGYYMQRKEKSDVQEILLQRATSDILLGMYSRACLFV